MFSFQKDPINKILIIAFLFTIIMLAWGGYSYGSSFGQDFSANLLATFLGVIIGIPFALIVSQYQESKTEKEKKEKVLKLIYENLFNNYFQLIDWMDKPTIENVDMLVVNMRHELWKAFSEGGEINWIKDTETLAYLAEAFSSTYVAKDLAAQYFNSIFSLRVDREDKLSRYLYLNLVYACEMAIGMTSQALRVVYNKDDIPSYEWLTFNEVLSNQLDDLSGSLDDAINSALLFKGI